MLYTIGHSTRSIEAFIALLREHGIQLLVDVRRFPGSRRHPQFGGAALAASLEEAGIAYAHYMATPAFRAALDRLAAASRKRTTVIMCAEAVPWRCHRRLITDALLARGIPVLDIIGPGPASPARLSEH